MIRFDIRHDRPLNCLFFSLTRLARFYEQTDTYKANFFKKIDACLMMVIESVLLVNFNLEV
ncbi:hypothetical protein SINU_01345 [Sporolactobacillus inulinus CASD]|uniref:Uncharacterized protein n=1 Tax=Sporolactobacillus inulinus CASD TaxID=1069536 RepID=A0A0U1QSE9_9BACL|nr:hypothetical protein SINU_01345 [Sporolactobacillus inulinus CASD]